MADQQDLSPRTPRRGAGPAPLGLAAALALALLSAYASTFAHAAAPKPVVSSNLDQIQNQYAQDPAAARSKFQKVAVQFTALADKVDAAQAQGLIIDFHTTQHPQPIRAVFLKSAAAGHGAVRHGEMVRAHCETIVEVAGKPELRDCVFR
jgi:hypothetical protein